MGERPILKQFISYALLNVLGMLGLSCYILADTFFVSNGIGTNGLTALNLAIPVYSFVNGAGLMLGIGGATKYSILRAQGGGRESLEVFTNVLYMALACSAVFFLCGIFLPDTLTAALGANSQVFEMTSTYIRIILLFSPAFILNNVLICFVRNDGAPRLSMLAMLGGSFSNIVLDYIFIFPLGWGMFGAVFATGLAPVISLVILSRHLLSGKNRFHLAKSKVRPRLVWSTVALGFPSLFTEVSAGIVIIVFNAIILKISGNTGVAAYGVIANISLVVAAVYTGIAQGVQPLVSGAYGRGDHGSAKAVLRYAVISVFAISAVVYAGIYLFADPITGIFNSENNKALQLTATSGLRIYFTAAVFLGFNIVISAFFTSTEKALPAHVISLLRGLIIIVPMAFILSSLLKINGVWLAFPVSEGLAALLGLCFYLKLPLENTPLMRQK